MSAVEIRTVDRVSDPKTFKKEFVLFPWKIYRDKGYKNVAWKNAWCPPLLIDQLDRFDPSKNVFLEKIKLQAFVAYRDGKAVGRITAQVVQGHLDQFKDDCGFFGYFECIEDYEVAKVLFETAAKWLKERGMKKVRGPFSFSINDDWGWKCDCGPGMPGNFETMSMIYQPHNPAYYNDFALKWGMEKVQDHYAYHLDEEQGLSEKMTRVSDLVLKRAEKSTGKKITYRHGDLKEWDREVAFVKEIHDDAWETNWGTIPYTSEELDHVGKDLKLVILANFIWFVFVDEEVAGFVMALPDVNEVQRKINGRLFPFGLIRLLWGLKVAPKFTRGRCILLGMKKKYRGMGLEAPLITKMFQQAKPMGVKDIELSWILESNVKMRKEVEPFSDRIWMSFRAYERAI